MNTTDPRSWPDKLMGLCLGFLFAAIALYVSVQLIASVWQVLLLIVAAVSAAMFAMALVRARNRGEQQATQELHDNLKRQLAQLDVKEERLLDLAESDTSPRRRSERGYGADVGP